MQIVGFPLRRLIYQFLINCSVVVSIYHIFQLYICDENTTATEYDFKKALDLMQFIDSVSIPNSVDFITFGPSCSKLMTSLVNDSSKFQT